MPPIMPSFPAEIWLLIRDILMLPWRDRHTLAHLCRTCKALRVFAGPALYTECGSFLRPSNENGVIGSICFYRTMLESPRLAALLKVFGTNLCHDIVGSDTDGELREIVRDTEKEAEEIARLVRQTVVDRFRYPYDVSLVMNREWGPWPLVGIIPLILQNLREITF